MTSCDKQTLNRLKRAEGQLRGVINMIQEEKDCKAVITQLTAVRSSVDHIMGIIVAENLKNCLENPELDEQTQIEKTQQAIQMIIKK